MSNVRSLFAGLRDAKVTERGVWLREGLYEVRVKRGFYKITRAKGDAFILEFTIEKSNYEDAKRKAVTALGNTPYDMMALEKMLPNQAGTSASWYQALKDKDVGFGALKGFCAAILGEKPEDPKFLEEVEGFMAAVCDDGVINGMLIPVEVVQVKTRENKDFSRHNWGKIIQLAATA